MKEIIRSGIFAAWLHHLKNNHARMRIIARIERMSQGLLGDVKPIGQGLSELRIDCGPGYRIYFLQEGERIVVLLCGGDKRSQKQDILLAKKMAADWRAQKND